MRLQSCQANVQFAVTSAQLVVQIRSETDRRESEGQLLALQKKIEEHLALISTQRVEARRRHEEFQEGLDDEEDDGAQRTLAAAEVTRQLRVLENDQVSSGVILSQVQSQRTGQKIGNIVTSGNSQAWVGMPASVVGRITQQIGNVNTRDGSTARVGVFN
ncbi:putative cytochrome p450 [Rosellinia necatrix]|uniref:Putative cytochrome p450 n=1 Tax=Rosellinia necatrix TaxID=77044 RepID=A0A1W2TIU6_ROSNE|nr:putative cytochrome p450 [Rosellinia necatrix]